MNVSDWITVYNRQLVKPRRHTMGASCFKDDVSRERSSVSFSKDGVDSGRVEVVRDSRNAPLPPRPKSMSKDKIRVKALYNFEAINSDDLSFKKGDLMEIEDSVAQEDDWWVAVHLTTHEKGYIPSNYVVVDDTAAENQDWWCDFDRKEADKMLLLPGNPTGTFLVRESTDKMTYVLSVRDLEKINNEPCVKHYRIRKLDNGKGFFISSKISFPSLFELIEYYKQTQDGLCCNLFEACPKKRPNVQFRDLEIRREMVELTTKLGAGCFGDVWKGKLRKVVDVAVKTLKRGTMTSEAFLQEAKIMHKLTHPKLVLLMAVVSVQEPFYIITELMINGALLDYLRSEKGKRLTFSNLLDMNSQIAEGMTYLESENFVHRDLRAANILIGENLEVKVADFGLARILEDDDDVYQANVNTKFPIKWTAPEAALHRHFSVKSDVWSFGIVMYEIITLGKVPYPGMNGREVLSLVESGRRMEKPTFSQSFLKTDSYFDQMYKCWDQNAEERPTFEYLHHFFDNYEISSEERYGEIDQ